MIARNPLASFRVLTCLATVGLAALNSNTLSAQTPARPQPPEVGDNEPSAAVARSIAIDFAKQVRPLIQKHCLDCHNVDNAEAGVRLDRLDGTVPDNRVRHWEHIRRQIDEGAMPPEDAEPLSKQQRRSILAWIDRGLDMARSREVPKNGSVRRLTIAQYQNSLNDLLGIEEVLTDTLPPDSVSKAGFANNSESMVLSPLLLEGYFDVARQALDRCIVAPDTPPVVQFLRVELGESINSNPCPDSLILGANSHLLANEDFVVTQPRPPRPFQYTPFEMQTKFRFNEGYQGNATVRGWREYDSIYHAVFACMRGNPGYPKGEAYETVPDGLLLRPAIPSAELFGVESTYGPRANFKISLRQLPSHGRFRVTVRAAKYDDGLLLDGDTLPIAPADSDAVLQTTENPATVMVPKAGVYQVDVHLASHRRQRPEPVVDQLEVDLAGHWKFDGDATAEGQPTWGGEERGGVKFVPSPFSTAASFDGRDDEIVIPRQDAMNVGQGDFTVAAWIRPEQLRQGGIVCLGGYNYTHGWLLDMPNNQGTIRLETAKPDGANGTVESRPGVVRKDVWQHVAVSVTRGENGTRLYVNGFAVGRGTIGDANLDNAKVDLHIGRIQEANRFQGQIDDVRVYRRALSAAEISGLVQPGAHFVKPPPAEKPQALTLRIGGRKFTATLRQPPFVALRLESGPVSLSSSYAGKGEVDRVLLKRLPNSAPTAQAFLRFERQAPRVGVHLGLRRDCGSTLNPVGPPQAVHTRELRDYVFEGDINNFPRPDVQEDNDNYLAGVREIGVRSEFTDGRDMPRLRIRSIQFEGPLYDNWPPQSHRNIFIVSSDRDDPRAYASQIIERFATRAFRRPVQDSELSSLLDVWQQSYAESGNFPSSIQDALTVVLTSPQFLFLVEESTSPKAEPLNDWELAAKLSYFLNNTTPDDRLLKLAAAGDLRESLADETTRLIGKPQFDQFLDQFATQWLALEKFAVVEFDRARFPHLTRDARAHLTREPIEYLDHLIQHNLSVEHLVRSDFVVANEVVAKYYGFENRVESGFQFVPLEHRRDDLGGLLTQAAILGGLSDGRESNPVKRGAWLARKIVAEPPDDPPPNVPELGEDTTHLPLRERLRQHREQKGCVKCHAGIDPWGIPFEEFDASGLRKQTEVDASSTLPDGTNVRGVQELKRYLAEDRIDQVAYGFLQHLTVYACGRSLTYNESRRLKEAAVQLKHEGYRMQDMIRFVVTSDTFLEK